MAISTTVNPNTNRPCFFKKPKTSFFFKKKKKRVRKPVSAAINKFLPLGSLLDRSTHTHTHTHTHRSFNSSSVCFVLLWGAAASHRPKQQEMRHPRQQGKKKNRHETSPLFFSNSEINVNIHYIPVKAYFLTKRLTYDPPGRSFQRQWLCSHFPEAVLDTQHSFSSQPPPVVTSMSRPIHERASRTPSFLWPERSR